VHISAHWQQSAFSESVKTESPPVRGRGMTVIGAKLFECVCPTCGKAEGPFYLRQSLWFYCREHKVKWLAAFNI
jgi:hypothetical protein